MKTLIVFMVLCLLLVGCSSSGKYWTKENYDPPKVGGEDWKLCYSDSRMGQYYYDAENIIHASANVIRVWVKGILTDELIVATIDEIGEKYRDLSYLIFLTEINCKDKIMRDLKTTFYSKQGVAMLSIRSTGTRGPISPGSMGESLYQAVCK